LPIVGTSTQLRDPFFFLLRRSSRFGGQGWKPARSSSSRILALRWPASRYLRARASSEPRILQFGRTSELRTRADGRSGRLRPREGLVCPYDHEKLDRHLMRHELRREVFSGPQRAGPDHCERHLVDFLRTSMPPSRHDVRHRSHHGSSTRRGLHLPEVIRNDSHVSTPTPASFRG